VATISCGSTDFAMYVTDEELRKTMQEKLWKRNNPAGALRQVQREEIRKNDFKRSKSFHQ